MKRVLTFWMCLMMLVGGSWALAEDVAARLNGLEVVELENGARVDLDGDGAAEAITLTARADEYGCLSAYTLTIGEAQTGGQGDSLTGRLFAAKLNGAHDVAYVLVSDYGPSDDDTSYIYRYEGGEIKYVGVIGSMPENLELHGSFFTGHVRGYVLHTWFRPGDFLIAHSTGLVDEVYTGEIEYYVVEVPRAIYPMGSVVTAQMDIPLYQTQTGTEIALTIAAGEQVVLTATDDVAWLYLTTLDTQRHSYVRSGWLKLGDNGYLCLIDGASYDGNDVFSGLCMAD